jgi:hypothetical protein
MHWSTWQMSDFKRTFLPIFVDFWIAADRNQAGFAHCPLRLREKAGISIPLRQMDGGITPVQLGSGRRTAVKHPSSWNHVLLDGEFLEVMTTSTPARLIIFPTVRHAQSRLLYDRLISRSVLIFLSFPDPNYGTNCRGVNR